MKTYYIKIVETRSQIVEVHADSLVEAVDKAENVYYDGTTGRVINRFTPLICSISKPSTMVGIREIKHPPQTKLGTTLIYAMKMMIDFVVFVSIKR